MARPKKQQTEKIIQKLNELDSQLTKSNQTIFAYLNAIVQLLVDAGITDQKKFREYLNTYKAQFSKLAGDAEFLKLMRQLKKGKKK